MESIGSINTIPKAIDTLKELFILNVTQTGILKGKLDHTNKEQICNFRKEITEKIDIIIKSEKLTNLQKIKHLEAAIECTYNLENMDIEELRELYITIMVQNAIIEGRLNKNINTLEQEENKKDIDYEKVREYQKGVEKSIDELLENIEDNDPIKKLRCLKSILENIIGEQNDEVKEKIGKISKQYFKKLVRHIENIKEEKGVLEIIDELNLKIYEDKEVDEQYSYGDLVKNKRRRRERLLNDDVEDKEFIAVQDYITSKISKYQDKDKIKAKINDEYVTKYELYMKSKTGEIASLEFFGKKEIENSIKNKDKNYMNAILAAIAKAKKEEREYIGRVYVIDEELGTSVVQYDDNLEQSVKNLIKKEKSKKIEQSENSENIENRSE